VVKRRNYLFFIFSLRGWIDKRLPLPVLSESVVRIPLLSFCRSSLGEGGPVAGCASREKEKIMQVRLKVLDGKLAGKEIKIPVSKFFIGRGEDCHLRPQSDLISRHHCALVIDETRVVVRDLKSRNGTLVNGEKIAADVTLIQGDTLQVGPLKFEVHIEATQAPKRPKVEDVKEAAQRVAQTGSKDDLNSDEDISAWLTQADETDRLNRMHGSGETRQFRLDLTEQAPAATGDTNAGVHDTAKLKAEGQAKVPEKKKQFGKLPQVNADNSASSRDAAAEMLKKFFNRR
jgi:pSer/pThr/pTyr-binding forkhead associated (FHA) protein